MTITVNRRVLTDMVLDHFGGYTPLDLCASFGSKNPKALLGLATSTASVFGYHRLENALGTVSDALSIPGIFYSSAKAVQSLDSLIVAVQQNNLNEAVAEGWEFTAKTADTVADAAAIIRLVATCERGRVPPALPVVETVCSLFSTAKSIYDEVGELREGIPVNSHSLIVGVSSAKKSQAMWDLAADVSSLVLPILEILGTVLAPIFTFVGSLVYLICSIGSFVEEKKVERLLVFR
jgi:hypothetical protein